MNKAIKVKDITFHYSEQLDNKIIEECREIIRIINGFAWRVSREYDFILTDETDGEYKIKFCFSDLVGYFFKQFKEELEKLQGVPILWTGDLSEDCHIGRKDLSVYGTFICEDVDEGIAYGKGTIKENPARAFTCMVSHDYTKGKLELTFNNFSGDVWDEKEDREERYLFLQREQLKDRLYKSISSIRDGENILEYGDRMIKGLNYLSDIDCLGSGKAKQACYSQGTFINFVECELKHFFYEINCHLKHKSNKGKTEYKDFGRFTSKKLVNLWNGVKHTLRPYIDEKQYEYTFFSHREVPCVIFANDGGQKQFCVSVEYLHHCILCVVEKYFENKNNFQIINSYIINHYRPQSPLGMLIPMPQ